MNRHSVPPRLFRRFAKIKSRSRNRRHNAHIVHEKQNVPALNVKEKERLQKEQVLSDVPHDKRIHAVSADECEQDFRNNFFDFFGVPLTSFGSGFAWFRANRTPFLRSRCSLRNGFAATTIPCASLFHFSVFLVALRVKPLILLFSYSFCSAGFCIFITFAGTPPTTA